MYIYIYVHIHSYKEKERESHEGKSIVRMKNHEKEGVQIRSYFWPECRKMRTRNNSVFGLFSRRVRIDSFETLKS